MNRSTDGPGVTTVTVANTTPDLYMHEMQTRLAEWHHLPLEPKFEGRQWIPLLLITVILPGLALIGGWFA